MRTRSASKARRPHIEANSKEASADGLSYAAAIKAKREEKGVSLRELEKETKTVDPTGRGVSVAHLHRVERGRSHFTLPQLQLIARALRVPLLQLLLSADEAVVVHKKSDYDSVLEDLDTGRRQVERSGRAHQEMIEAKAYRYAPLQADQSDVPIAEKAGEAERAWGMQKYVFEICSRSDGRDIKLDEHPGEEVVFVLEGEAELHLEFPGGKRVVRLGPGDCAQYTASIPHGYRPAAATQKTRALFVFTRHAESGRDIITVPPHT